VVSTAVADDRWCFAWFAAPLPSTASDRVGLLRSSRWPGVGPTIRIAFLDGTEEQIALVKRLAVGWNGGPANLNFSWVTHPSPSDVRITFRFRGSWSVIGTTCRNVPRDEATMNFGWLTPGVAELEARRVVLHEFGHALGLIHEHQRLDPNLWNRQAVVAALSGPPNRWDRQTIEHNMFEMYPPNSVDGSMLDTTSIMMYPIPAGWRLDGVDAGTNHELSPTDRAFIRKMYP
jgi:Astacin (Peptidase family M12A)